MIPELGPYAGTVLAAYGVALGLLAGLVVLSWARAVRVRRALARAEEARTRSPARPASGNPIHAP